jgi:hypothetical protein
VGVDWDVICAEAEALARQFAQHGLDAGECLKLAKLYAAHRYSEQWVARYLELMASNPPPRSKKFAPQFARMRTVWLNWRTRLEGREKALAWGWAARIHLAP